MVSFIENGLLRSKATLMSSSNTINMDTTTLNNILEKVNQMEGVNSGAYVDFANAMRKYFDSKDKPTKVIGSVMLYDTKMVLYGEKLSLTIELVRHTSYIGPFPNEITYKLNNHDERSLQVHQFKDKLAHYFMLVSPTYIKIEMDGITTDVDICEYIKSLYKINKARGVDDNDDDDDPHNFPLEYVLGCMIGIFTP